MKTQQEITEYKEAFNADLALLMARQSKRNPTATKKMVKKIEEAELNTYLNRNANCYNR